MPALARQAAVPFLRLATLALLVVGLVYGVAQQQLRMAADDPQLQLAEDAAAALDAGAGPASVVPAGDVDLARSLAIFTVVTGPDGAIVAGNARLDGEQVAPPAGVLETARRGTTDRVTWQPRAGVRLAQATVGWGGGAVTVGRSLREVERREDAILVLCAAALLATLAALALVCVVTAAWRAPGRAGGAPPR